MDDYKEGLHLYTAWKKSFVSVLNAHFDTFAIVLLLPGSLV